MSDENNPALLDRVVTGYPRTKTADKLTAPAFVWDLEVMRLVNDEFTWMGEIQGPRGDHRSPTPGASTTGALQRIESSS